MDPMDFLEPEDLLPFFHCNKTEISCVENPKTFINQLRDHNLIPEDRYKKLIRMKSKEKMKTNVYELLDWLERERSKHITVFWRCVFKETIMNQYPIFRLLRNSLMDGSFRSQIQLPEKIEEDPSEAKRKELSEDEEEEEAPASPLKKKKKLRNIVREDDEESVSSSVPTLGQRKKSKKLSFSSPLKKGQKGEIWSWPIYKCQLPVTCGRKAGMLNRQRLAKGEKCIAVDKEWFTPAQFEKFAGKESYRNWKLSIRCEDVPLGKLIQDGHLKSANFRASSKRAKKSLFPSEDLTTVSDEEEEGEEDDEDEDEGEEQDEEQPSSSRRGIFTEDDEDSEEQAEQQPDVNIDTGKKVFKVTCEDKAATFHLKRFAAGNRGKSIRTETSWMTPVEFIKWASSCQADPSWRKDIIWEGNPLGVLIQAKGLIMHTLLCSCRLCKPDREETENQRNDDECCICKSEDEEEKLVVCDLCPRSFHQRCHLPHVDNAILGDSKPWNCTFCVFRIAREWMTSEEVERDAALSRPISQHMMGCQYLLLCLCSADEEQTFATNPSSYLKDYTTVVKTPMWLEKVADKLHENLYKTVGNFVSDIQLIFANCASYNRDNEEFLAMGNRMKELFEEELKKVFNIREENSNINSG